MLITQPPKTSPRFRAYLGATIPNYFGAGVTYPIVFDVEDYDYGNVYNAVTGVATAPFTGTFEGVLAFQTEVGTTHPYGGVSILSSLTTWATALVGPYPVAAGQTTGSPVLPFIIPCTIGETFQPQAIFYSGARDMVLYANQTYSYWGGKFIRPGV